MLVKDDVLIKQNITNDTIFIISKYLYNYLFIRTNINLIELIS